jgi:hypothetical protein
MHRLTRRALALSLLTLAPSASALGAQSTAEDRAAAVAIADSALVRITRQDFAGLADLMLPEGRTFSARLQSGEIRYNSSTREQQRVATSRGRITERGFGPQVFVSGALATVWMPYDLYIDGVWSHCGVDAFTMLKVAGRWQIATMAWSVVQPPDCERHPDGPPRS